MTYNEIIKTYRKKAGLTQKQLAELCNVAQSTIASYEAGKSIPSAENAIKIANILNFSYTDLFNTRMSDNALPENLGLISLLLKNARFTLCHAEYTEEMFNNTPELREIVSNGGSLALSSAEVAEAIINNRIVEVVGNGVRSKVKINDICDLVNNASNYFEFELNKLIQKAGAAEDGKEN